MDAIEHTDRQMGSLTERGQLTDLTQHPHQAPRSFETCRQTEDSLRGSLRAWIPSVPVKVTPPSARNLPERVRRNAERCAPQPSACADLMRVGADVEPLATDYAEIDLRQMRCA